MLSIQELPKIKTISDAKGLSAGVYRLESAFLERGIIYTTGHDIEWLVFDDNLNYPSLPRFALGRKWSADYTDRDESFSIFLTKREIFFDHLSSFEPESLEFILFNQDLFG